jgi:glycosyltransferase involved in cell wall biosynthesis
MKKICIITTVHNAFDTRIFYKQAHSLIKAGNAVTLIARYPRKEIIDCIEIIALPMIRNRAYRIFISTLIAFYKAIRVNAHVYHLHDPELIPVGILLKLCTGRKIIFDLHEDIYAQILSKKWIPKFSNTIIAQLTILLIRAVCNQFDRIIVAGDDIVLRLNFTRKLLVLHNYPSLAVTKNSNHTLKQYSKTRPPIIIYVGGIAKHRGIYEILSMLKYLKNEIRLLCIGPFEDEILLSDIQKGIYGNNVTFTGRINYRNVYQYLKRSYAGLLILHPNPNNIHAVSRNNKLYEYMAAGLPVITSQFVDWKKLVEQEKCGVTVNPNSPKDIARAVDYLINNPTIAHKMGENGKKAVLQRYNWEREEPIFLKLYSELLEINQPI